MRKRFFIPIFVLFVFFPLIIFLLSFTRFFNDEVRDALIYVVDNATNAQLHLGEIHGSVFGSFRIDGAALVYRGEPIALVDTVRISHLPLSLVTRTIQVTNLELANPRFYLVRYKDGSFNVDHIGKPTSGKAGKFDWTIIARNVNIRNGQFSLYDSTVSRGEGISSDDKPPGDHKPFDVTDFFVRDLRLDASAELTGDNLSANVRNLAMRVDPAGFRIDSLGFAFFTSPGGTEVSGFRLRTGRSLIHLDLTLTGQGLLDSLNKNTIKDKYFTGNIDARNVEVGDVERFVKLPLNSRTKFDLSLFASGTLDSLSVKQFLLSTDSSVVPVSALFRNLPDSSMTMQVSTDSAGIDMGELSSIFADIGIPEMGRLRKVNLNASATGRPNDLILSVDVSNDNTSVSGTSRLRHGMYDGELNFRGLDIGEILNSETLKTGLNGEATFSLQARRGSFPDGTVSVKIDSSGFDRIAVPGAVVRLSSVNDSVATNFNFLTSRGNIDGQASLSVAASSYYADIKFSELNAGLFVHVPALNSDLTGRLMIEGQGFNLDSLESQVSLVTERSSIGNFQLGNSAFTVGLNTRRSQKELQVHSPYFDASVVGHFVPHKLPAQLADLFTAIADSFSTRLSGRTDSTGSTFAGVPTLDADVDLDVKDAAIFGQLLDSTELSGSASSHVRLKTGSDSVSISGYFSLDTLSYAKDSLNLNGSRTYVGFNYFSNSGISLWDSASWSTDASLSSFKIGGTRLAARDLHVSYGRGDSASPPQLTIRFRGQVDTLAEFGMNATADVTGDRFAFVADSLEGKFFGVPLRSESPVHIDYSPETFSVSRAAFYSELGSMNDTIPRSKLTVAGSYSLRTGADLHFLFSDLGLNSIQRIARLDTNTLKLSGMVNGRADLNSMNNMLLLSVDFTGRNIGYNGSFARLVKGSLGLSGRVMSVDAELSKDGDSSRYSLRLTGNVPLSAQSNEQLHVDLAADSQDVSFLAPFMPGIEDFGGTLSGNLAITGSYSSPEMKGKLAITDGRIRLAANEVNYLYNAEIVGEGNRLLLSPLVIRNIPGETGGTIVASGPITIGQNTIKKFDVVFDGSVLVLNSSSQRTLQGIYGTAIVGGGTEGLRLGGSLARPMLSGTLSIQSADLALLPVQKQERLAAQEIIYHFPEIASEKKTSGKDIGGPAASPPVSSGSLIDSLRYDVEVETKDNVNLRMIFDPTTNEMLSAVLGGRLHLSNLSGHMELIGDVSVLNNSYYNFYGRHFAATGKLSFTGDPLNPSLDITAQYQGEHADTSGGASSTGKTQNVVVQLGISGTFDRPNPPDISMTVDGSPYQGDAQTNAISFILTNQFADELTSPVKRSVADNLWNQAGAGILTAGTSILSGALTNLFSREFSFIRSAELRYSSITDLGNPDVAITTQFGKATIRVGGQVFSDINNTDVSMDYPLTELLGNMLYLQLSHKMALNNRTIQRETVNALRLFYRLSF